MKMTVEQLDAYLTMPNLPEPECKITIKHHDVELKNVHFSYSGEKKDEVLHGIDLTLPEGSYTALVGPSGGGKSTVAKLIARFWDVTEGTICIGGVDIRRPRWDSLRSTLSRMRRIISCSAARYWKISGSAIRQRRTRK